ncbi:MAG: hypothetical protein IJ025_05875, partial [Clostridia bacterium]|nr:hypothetical protein [Clostridia bacterium]
MVVYEQFVNISVFEQKKLFKCKVQNAKRKTNVTVSFCFLVFTPCKILLFYILSAASPQAVLLLIYVCFLHIETKIAIISLLSFSIL